MPELPEVETMRRGILGAMGGKVIGVQRIPCARKPIRVEPTPGRIRNRIAGKSVLGVDRIGKRVVLCLGQKQVTDYLVFEPRMTGLVLVAAPPTQEHLRFRLSLGNCDVDEILYWDRRGLGNIRLYNPAQLKDRFSRKNIGIDALKIKLDEFIETFSPLKREIKVALLDQKQVAGVGNLYASELLHTARIHPERTCNGLTQAELQRVHEQMIRILQTAIRYEGSTLSDGTYRNALNQSGSYQNQHLVYDREGEKCQQCKRGRITRIVQAQRATFYCKSCQRKKN